MPCKSVNMKIGSLFWPSLNCVAAVCVFDLFTVVYTILLSSSFCKNFESQSYKNQFFKC